MVIKKIIPLIILLCSLCQAGFARTHTAYPFASAAQAQRFQLLTQELRCLVCQNQSLTESNAPLANDLRHQVYHRVVQGQTNDQIKTFLVERYGDFILFRPRFTKQNSLLWWGPLFLLLMALSVGVCVLRAHRKEHT